MSQYYYAKKFSNKEKWLTQGALISLMVACLFNSPLKDNAEELWFARQKALYYPPQDYRIS